ncbi:hypothetical protein NLI96_g2618 [Meripilus lineatus]|uniref:Uncharacterized protein n=1 Tax=Meripilus lineatus TaxID=2056292 RepID=A0AAD5YHB5_9APHY|nr:hypothetical protein NLI96_g2618 [Physisporinus lineatus]
MFANMSNSTADFIVIFTALIYLSQFGFAAGLGCRLMVILNVMVLSPSVFLLGFLSLGFSLTLSCVLRLPPVRHLGTQVLVVVFMLPTLVWNASVNLVLPSLEALVDTYHNPVFFVFGLIISWTIESFGLRNIRAVVSSLELDNISLRTLNTSLLRGKKHLRHQLSSMRTTFITERKVLVDLQAEFVYLKERARAKRKEYKVQLKAFADQNLKERMEHCATRLMYKQTVEERDNVLRKYRSLKQDSRKRIHELEDIQFEDGQRIRNLESYVDRLEKEAGARDMALKECRELLRKQAFEILTKDILLLCRDNASSAPTVKPPVMVTSKSDTEHSVSFTPIVSPLEVEVSGEVEQVEASSVYSLALVLDRTSENTGFLKVEREEVGAVGQSLRSISIEASKVSTVGQSSTSSHFVEPSSQEERLLRSSVSMRPILTDLSSRWSMASSSLGGVSTTQEASARVGPSTTRTLDIPSRVSDTDNSLLVNGSLAPRTNTVASWPGESSSPKPVDSQEDSSFALFQPQNSSTPRSQSLLSRPGQPSSSKLASSFMLSQPQASSSPPRTPSLPPSIHPPKLRFSDNLLLSNGRRIPRPPTLVFGPSGSPPPTATGSRLASPFLDFRPQSSSSPRSRSLIPWSKESSSPKATGSSSRTSSFAHFRPQACSTPFIPRSPRLLKSEFSRFPF